MIKMCGILTPTTQEVLLKYFEPRDENEATSLNSFAKLGRIVKLVGAAEGLREIVGTRLGTTVGLVGKFEGSLVGEIVGVAVGRI